MRGDGRNWVDTDETSGLFDETTIGAWRLSHRIVMARLTRSRVGSERVPNPMMAEYYAQRASAALIVTEATIISEATFEFNRYQKGIGESLIRIRQS